MLLTIVSASTRDGHCEFVYERTGDSPWHTSILGTLPLTETSMSPDPSCSSKLSGSCSAVHGDLFADDEAIGDKLANGLAGIGVGDFAHLVGIEPDLTLTAACHGGGEALLGA